LIFAGSNVRRNFDSKEFFNEGLSFIISLSARAGRYNEPRAM
jgi:hypothetical protein